MYTPPKIIIKTKFSTYINRRDTALIFFFKSFKFFIEFSIRVTEENYVCTLQYFTDPDLVMGNFNQLIRFTFTGTGTGTVLDLPSHQEYLTHS